MQLRKLAEAAQHVPARLAVLQLHDIFGLSDWSSSPECVACLTEPKDTILLPCRHLCVCHNCFDHLTLDTCPICRAPFQSYLRFDVEQADGGDGSDRAAGGS